MDLDGHKEATVMIFVSVVLSAHPEVVLPIQRSFKYSIGRDNPASSRILGRKGSAGVANRHSDTSSIAHNQ